MLCCASDGWILKGQGVTIFKSQVYISKTTKYMSDFASVRRVLNFNADETFDIMRTFTIGAIWGRTLHPAYKRNHI